MQPIKDLSKRVQSAVAFDRDCNHDAQGNRMREANGETRLLIHIAELTTQLAEAREKIGEVLVMRGNDHKNHVEHHPGPWEIGPVCSYCEVNRLRDQITALERDGERHRRLDILRSTCVSCSASLYLEESLPTCTDCVASEEDREDFDTAMAEESSDGLG